MKTKLTIIYIICMIFLTACKGKSSGDGFSFLEDEPESSVADDILGTGAVVISSVAPTDNPVVFITGSNKTFGVVIEQGAGDVTYEFKLDGVVTQSSNSPFLEIDETDLTVGIHTLVVRVFNMANEDSHTFNIVRNSAPVAALASNTATTVNCSAGTFTLNISASDANGDAMTYSYLLNGGPSALLAGSSTPSTSQVIFTPNCGVAGANTVTIRVRDVHNDYDDYSIIVNVNNPNTASITSFSPVSNPRVILSNETVSFIIAATGNPPITYEWDINPGSVITACNGLSTCNISGGDFTPGAYTLTGNIEDNTPTTDFQPFNIVINDKPDIASHSPSNASTVAFNCATSKNFNVDVNDLNFSNPGQTFTFTWYLDGAISGTISKTDDVASYPMTSAATFSPNCAPNLLGDHEIKVVISDGYESDELTWNINVNYFSDTCNNLTAGQVCTLLGLPGMGSGLDASSAFARWAPQHLTPHPLGGWLFSDATYHAIWYYNNTGSSKTILGINVANGALKVVAGTGVLGLGTDGQTSRNFLLNTPRGIAVHSTTYDIYVAEYTNSRIAKFDGTTGIGTWWAGGGAGNTDATTRKAHKTSNPTELVLDEANNKLFVVSYSNNVANDGSVKYFMTNADTGYSLIKYNAANTEGTLGVAGTARSHRGYSLTKHPGKDILYLGDLGLCQVMALSYGGTHTYYSSPVVNLTNNNMVRLTLNAGCGNTVNRKWNNTTGRIRPYSLAPKMNGATFEGLFISNTNEHNITFLNTTGSDVSVGGNDVTAEFYHRALGSSSASYIRNEPAFSASTLYSQLGIYASATKLYAVDRSNFAIAEMDISGTASDGDIGDLLVIRGIGGYDGETAAHAQTVRLNNPGALSYHEDSQNLYYADKDNYRIRKVSLLTGVATTVVGSGTNGNSATSPQTPSTNMRIPRDIYAHPDLDILTYVDTVAGVAVSSNCLLRAYNMDNVSIPFMGQNMNANNVYSFAGNFADGCAVWNSANENTSATALALNQPYGMIVRDDGLMTYFSSYNNSCIQKINSSGLISTMHGECGTPGDAPGITGTSLITSPGDIALDPNPLYRASGNFFVVDRVGLANSSIKYVNNTGSTLNIAGLDVDPNSIGKIISGINNVNAVAAFDNQICYTQGITTSTAHNNDHNVICVNYNTGLQTLRVGKSSASAVRSTRPDLDEHEGVASTSATLYAPGGLDFDKEGNLYITTSNHTIVKVKRWW